MADFIHIFGIILGFPILLKKIKLCLKNILKSHWAQTVIGVLKYEVMINLN